MSGVSAPYPFTRPHALAPPSLPSRGGPLILMDGRSEGLLMLYNSAPRWTGKDMRSQCRRMSFALYPATAD